MITAGAGGMYCGSCLRDNTLAAALLDRGEDVILIPAYTPTRTDEPNVSTDRVSYGAANAFLQQKGSVCRAFSSVLGRLLDSPALLRMVSRWADRTDPGSLGEMTVSVLRGDEGRQHAELTKLAGWLGEEVKPDLVVLPNALFAGAARSIRDRTGSPVLCNLTGEDLFLESLPSAFEREAVEIVRAKSSDLDAFIATSRYYADHCVEYFGIGREKIHVVYPGVSLKDFEDLGAGGEGGDCHGYHTIGYLARVCPEKGLHVLADAFVCLKRGLGFQNVRLRAAGYLATRERPYLDSVRDGLAKEGLAGDFEYVGEVDRRGKVEFLSSLDVLSVPTTYREAKGLFVLEAWAAGVPVVQPAHGSFPELLDLGGGGLLVQPGDAAALAEGLREVLADRELRGRLGANGFKAARERFSADRMAEEAMAIYRQYAG